MVVDSAAGLEKCTRRPARIVRKNAKCLSSQGKIVLFIARNALRSTRTALANLVQNSLGQRARNFILVSVLSVLTLYGSAAAWADTVQTQDGKVWKGLVVNETARELKLDLGFDVATL